MRPPPSRSSTTLSLRTVNKQTSFLNDFWNWAAEHEGCADQRHPFRSLQQKPRGSARRNAAKEARDAFLLDDLARIFGADAWRAHRPLDEQGDRRAEGLAALFYAPLVAAYSGLRLGEICQLRRGDLAPFDGLWAFRVRPLSEAEQRQDPGRKRRNRVKSDAADQLVPVHPTLVRMGLIAYRNQLPGPDGGLLFPELTYDENAGYTRKVGRWFTRFRRDLGFDTETTTFHSLRHTFKTMLQASGRVVSRVMV